MKYLPVFTCGHPRVPANWVKWGAVPRQTLKCKTCRRLKRGGLELPGKLVFQCGHPNLDENRIKTGVSKAGVQRYRCKACDYAGRGIHFAMPWLDHNAVLIGVAYILEQREL